MTGLLDSDFIVYRTCTAKDQDLAQILEGVDWYINSIIKDAEVERCKIFLSGTENFRKAIDSTYKSTRKKEKPEFYHDVRDYMIKNWSAEVSQGCEADDLCGIYQSDDTITIGEDKDLLTIAGWHYRVGNKFKPSVKIFVTEDEAKRFFFTQLLTGDKIDCIPGLTNPEKLHHKSPPCFTEDTASKVLEGKSVAEMKEIVIDLYKEVHGDDWYERFDTSARLLFLRRKDAKEYFNWI